MQTADAQTDISKITNQSDRLTLRTQKGAQFLLLYFYFLESDLALGSKLLNYHLSGE